MNNCCICGDKRSTNRGKDSKWRTCGNAECRKEASRRRAREAYQNEKTSKPNVKRLLGISKMRKELNTKEKYLKASYGRNGSKQIARKYGILNVDVQRYRKELFTGMKLGQIRALRNKVVNQIPETNNPAKVMVYQIVDMEAFEKGGSGTYDGLKFDRIEYARELEMPFNGMILEG